MMYRNALYRFGLWLLALSMFGGVAQAERIKVYTGLGVGSFSVDYGVGAAGRIKTASVLGSYLSVAADVTPYLSFEFRYGRAGRAELRQGGVAWGNRKVSIDGLTSVLLRPQVPLGRYGHVYTALGVTSSKLRYSDGIVDRSNSKSGLSLGAGFKIHIQDTWSLGVEYTRYTSRTSFSANHGRIAGYALQLHYLLD